MEKPIELEVINDQIIKNICSQKCGAKCCMRVGSNFRVPISIQDFEILHKNNLSKFIIWDDKYPYLKSKDDGKCIFLNDQNLCGIHQHRPLSCRLFPFKGDPAHVSDFCLLYHSSSDKLKHKLKGDIRYSETSTGDFLFNSTGDQQYEKLYYDLLNSCTLY